MRMHLVVETDVFSLSLLLLNLLVPPAVGGKVAKPRETRSVADVHVV